MKNFLLPSLALALLLPSLGAANDGVAGLTAGGIVLGKTDAVAMKKEVLSVGHQLISVDYEFVNESQQDVEETIVFPLPAYPVLAQPIDSFYGQPNGFLIRVDGRPVGFSTRLVALLGKKDVTAQLKRIGLTDQQIAYNPEFEGYGNREASKTVPQFTPAQHQQLVKAGLVGQYNDHYGPLWSAQANYVWKQRFPVNQVVRVHHQYRPFPDGGIGSPDYISELRTTHCADKAFFAAHDKMVKSKPHGNYAFATVGYILKTGNTWKNGIEDFTLNVVKSAPSEVVSLCFPGTFKKINPTTYQVRLKNFRPTRDLDIYFGGVGGGAVDNKGVMPVLNK